MTSSTSTTLKRVREAQDAIDRARKAMDSVQSGLSTVESVAEKADSARRHPVRTGALFFVIAAVLAGAFLGIKNAAD